MIKQSPQAIELNPQEYTLQLINGTLTHYVCTKVFENNHTYIWCPKIPDSPSELKAMGYSDSYIHNIWEDFKASVKRHKNNPWYHLTFHGEEKTYWRALNSYAIIVNNKYYVCPSSIIDETILLKNGFKKKLLYIPVSQKEAYLSLTAESIDQLIY